MAGTLTPKQQLFVAEYLKDWNATQAAIRAGYSQHTAMQQGGRLLMNVEIRQEIDATRARLASTLEMEAADTLRELCSLATSDIGDVFDPSGRLLPVHQMPQRVRRAIASIKVTKKNLTAGDGVTEDVVEVRFWDKNKALENVGRTQGLFIDRRETGKPGEFANLSIDEKREKAKEFATRLRLVEKAG